MLNARDKALNTVKHFKIAPKCIEKLKRERTLHVVDAPPNWPSDVVARHCIRVALENGCTKIHVKQGTHRSQYYDVMDLIRYSRTLTPGGQLAVPKMKRGKVPADLATKGFAALGSFTDKKSTLVTVPSIVRVSGLSGTKGAR